MVPTYIEVLSLVLPISDEAKTDRSSSRSDSIIDKGKEEEQKTQEHMLILD